MHYHIRWSRPTGETLDWERFYTLKEAEDAARQLVLPGEHYNIGQFDSNCPRCAQNLKRFASNVSDSASAGLNISPDSEDPGLQVL